MKSTFFSLACTMVASLVIGCGGNVTGGSGGDGGSTNTAGSGGATGTTSTTTTTTYPQACAVETNLTAPYSVTFQFTVPTVGATYYLAENCTTEFSIFTCDDAYAASVAISGDCTVDCSMMGECIECGACPQGAVAVTSSTPSEYTWAGNTYTFGQNNVGCGCHNEFTAHAGKYRIVVPVYPTEQDAIDHTNAMEHTVDFDLPAPNGIVNVPLEFGLD